MKTVSIKSFIIAIMVIILLMSCFGFIYFYKNSSMTVEKLLRENIQTYMLNLRHYLNKNLHKNSINTIKSHLDTVASSSELIQNILLSDDKNKFLYSTSRDYNLDERKCVPLLKIKEKGIFRHHCYFFDIKVYRGIKPLKYKGFVVINEKYIVSLLDSYTNRLLIFFIVFGVLFFILFWKINSKIVIVPLEKLRQYAYYSREVPRSFFIKEFESIRYSLSVTFERLKKEQQELYKLSTQDTLSGLYNRLSLIDKLKWLISSNSRYNKSFTIIFIDLDNFKDINDTLGHSFGDEVLKKVSNILLNVVRENDIVARIGGDEFVIVLPDTADEFISTEIANRVRKELSKSMMVGDVKCNITASMGITVYPRDGENVEVLLKNSDIAMYKAKELGKNNFHFFTEDLNRIIEEKMSIQNMLKTAMEENWFELYYQPKVDVRSKKIVGAEALIRLNHPKKGVIPPFKFIPIAEESGFIIMIGEWVINEAVRQIRKWENTPLKNIKVSINVSAKQFRSSDFIDILSNRIKNIGESKLDIELTESAFIDNFDNNLHKINKIKEMGLTLSLDDFGTGYSSLSYLKNIPFDTIKIDKSFIDDILTDGKNKPFVNMIVEIAESLDFQVVAEGVETKEQLEYLVQIGCDMYQGYLCSKPVPAKEFEKLFLNMKC